MKPQIRTTRRQLLKTAALAGAAGLGSVLPGSPFVRHSRAAGKLAIAVWDHWTGEHSNSIMRKMLQEWGAKNSVDVTVDFITSIGDKLLLTATAEARAKTGHDIMHLGPWYTAIIHKSLEPVDDLAAENVKLYGPYLQVAEYQCKPDGQWRSLPAPTSSQSHPSVSRIDLFKQHCGLDVTQVFPADAKKRNKKLVDEWNWDNFLVYAEKLHKAGFPAGQPIGATSDAAIWLGALFASFGASLADAKGNPTVNTAEVRQAMEYMKKLTRFFPPDVYAWDDASNNKYILSGKGAWIQNPPSAWAIGVGNKEKTGVAVDTASKVWHHDSPRGPKGRFRGGFCQQWGIFSFSPNKSAARDLLRYMTKKEQIFAMLTAGRGFDLPMHQSLYSHPVWNQEAPPAGTLYNYPIRGDETMIVAGMPAPPMIAAQMYNGATISQLVARYTTGQNSMDEAIKWAEQEIVGFAREA